MKTRAPCLLIAVLAVAAASARAAEPLIEFSGPETSISATLPPEATGVDISFGRFTCFRGPLEDEVRDFLDDLKTEPGLAEGIKNVRDLVKVFNPGYPGSIANEFAPGPGKTRVYVYENCVLGKDFFELQNNLVGVAAAVARDRVLEFRKPGAGGVGTP